MIKTHSQLVVLILLTLFLISGCGKQESEPQRVSIYELLVHPERFERKRVLVTGYYDAGAKNLFMNQIDSNESTETFRRVGILVDLNIPTPAFYGCRGNYVEIDGYFSSLRNHNARFRSSVVYNARSIQIITRNDDSGQISKRSCFSADDYAD